MLWLDRKYLQQVSSYLRNFKDKGNNLWNFSCPFCGDSQKKQTKARGYLYAKNNDLFFRCNNCQHGTTFFRFLQHIDKNLAKDYQLEGFREVGGKSCHNFPDPDLSEVFKPIPFFQPKSKEKQSFLDTLLDRVDTLDTNHPAQIFLRDRAVSPAKFSRIYYLDDTKNLCQLSKKYIDKITSREPRIVFPFFTRQGKLTGLSARSINGQGLRYLNLSISDSDMGIFGLMDVDYNKDIFVVEGAIDSLFLSNSVAVSGSSLASRGFPFASSTAILVYDNEPRNKDILNLIEKSISANYRVCIWPEGIKEKDINDMVLAGRNPAEIEQIIIDNTFTDLKAKMKFNYWKRG